MPHRQWPSLEISHLKVYNYQNFTEELPQDSDHLQKFHIWKYYLSFTVQGNKYMIYLQKSHVLQIAMQKSQSSIELS